MGVGWSIGCLSGGLGVYLGVRLTGFGLIETPVEWVGCSLW